MGPLPTLHLLTHLPKHPDCKVCRKAKAQRRPVRRVKRGPGTNHPEPTKLGEIVSLDHWIASDDPTR
eukprot:5982529-Prorocentrum_lima.AAC.1